MAGTSLTAGISRMARTPVAGRIALVLGLALVLPAPARGRTTLIWVEIPGARGQTVRDLASDGLLPWLKGAIARGDLRTLVPADLAPLDSLREAIRGCPTPVVDVGWRARPAAGQRVLRLAGSLREAPAWLAAGGGPSVEFADAWDGRVQWGALRRIAGIEETLRWEEVEEFTSLTPAENAALLSMDCAPEHPLWRLRRAFAADKLLANAALYFGRVEKPPRVLLRLELASTFEEDLCPWAEEVLAHTSLPAREEEDRFAARRRFFLHRLRSSAPRIYGRLDRVLQSLQEEWDGDACLIVDASGSRDPFLAVHAPAGWPQTASPPQALRSLLAEIGWDFRGLR